MKGFDERFGTYHGVSVSDIAVQDMLEEKDRIIETARKDMESLKREIVSLKKELNYSKSKKK